MSTLKVSEIRNASSATGGLSIAADGVVSGALPSPNRNLLYNGAMQVAQRGTSSSGITSGGYLTVDRWSFGIGSMGTFTMSVENDAPFAAAGLSKSIKVLCTTADSTPAGSDSIGFTQILEGQDCQRIKKGSAAAEQLTVSFWVKANVTGTYIVELVDADNARRISASYSISASATWEKKIITFPGDTTGGLDNDNAGSFILRFWLGAGSDYTSGSPLNTSWGTATNTRATGQTNLAAATNNYWQVTGVQLEVGDTATDFEHLPFGVELARCQRYFEKTYNVDVAPGTSDNTGRYFANTTTDAGQEVYLPIRYRIEKRANPTITGYLQAGTAGSWNYERSGASGSATFGIINAGTSGAIVYCENLGATWVAAQVYGHMTISAEL